MFLKSRNLVRSVRGATAIEYALIASLIAVAAVGGMLSLGTSQGENWNEVNDKL